MRRVDHRIRRWIWLPLSLALVPCIAHAERVLLLDFPGDREGRIREQLQTALLQTGVKLVPRTELEDAVEMHNGYLGWTLSVADAQPVARKLGVNTIVTANVSGELDLRLFDASGGLLWNKRLALTDGRLSPEHVQRLTAAIVVASRLGRHRAGERAGRSVLTGGSPAPMKERAGAALPVDPEIEAQRQAALAEIAASREAARKRREEAYMLEQRARAAEKLEAARAELVRREAKIKARLEQAAARYQQEVAAHQAELEREREAAAKRSADALRRREEISKRLEEVLGQPKPAAPPGPAPESSTGAAKQEPSRRAQELAKAGGR